LLSQATAPAGVGTLDDGALMELVARGDAGAFEALLRRHGDVAYSLARGICTRRTMAEDVTQCEQSSEIRAALDQLPRQQRQVIELAYFDGCSHWEIARMLELPAGTVKGRMRLGLQKLRGALDG
jgi:DNA-directed RNA polymerase specialized sigma24 family protein